MIWLGWLGCGGSSPCPEGTIHVSQAEGDAVLSECRDRDGRLQGLRERTRAGVPLWREHLLNGVRHGPREQYDGGLTVLEEVYEHGERQGPTHGRHPSGGDMFIGAFERGWATGAWSFFTQGATSPTVVVDFDKGRPGRWNGVPTVQIRLPVVDGRVEGETLPGFLVDGVVPRLCEGERELEVIHTVGVLDAKHTPVAVAGRVCSGERCSTWGLHAAIATAGGAIPTGCEQPR